MGMLARDVKHAIRRLRSHPAFTAIVVLTLALGLGANTAIFSVVNTVLLRPLPYREPGQLVTIYHYYPSLNHLEAPVSAPGFRLYHDQHHDFATVAIERPERMNLTGQGEPQRLVGVGVSGDFFHTLGVPVAMGRALVPDDDVAGRNHVVVLSDAFWHRLFGGDPSVLGRTVVLDDEPYDVVGVAAASFHDPWGRDADLWLPLGLTPANFASDNETYALTARLAPGVTIDAAARDMRALAQHVKAEFPNRYPPDWTLEVKSLDSVSTGPIRPVLLLLLGAVGFVLLIACANVANLLLARAATRSREVAIRTALGASRWDLVRQLLVESALISLLGGVLGLALAYWSVRALVAFNPGNVPRVAELGIDGHVIVFTLLISLATAVVFGLAPALQSARTDLQGTLREGGRGGTADRGGLRVRRGLVVAEVALALTLLTGAGLLIRSVSLLAGVDPGFDPHRVLTFSLSLPRASYRSDTAQIAFFDAAIQRMAAIPGVRAVGATSVMPFGGGWSTGSFNVEGYTPPPKGSMPWGDIRVVTPDFFRALRVPLLAGRTFTTADRSGTLLVAVVDEEFVHRFYGRGTNPVGKRISFGSDTPKDSTRYVTIVGVVGHTKHEGLDAPTRVQVYLSMAQAGNGGAMDVAVRTAGDPERYVTALRAAVHAVDANVPLARVRTLDDMVNASLGSRRLSTILLGVFAGLALVLASLGIYGVMSYAVAQRAREMGVRMALGARPGDVLRLVVQQGMTLVLAGVGVGLVCALLLTRLIASQLYGVHASDPLTFLVVSVLLVCVALVATLVPARRATRVDPVVTLREE